jgi:hypothetical protein
VRIAWALLLAACGPGHFDRDRMDAVVARARPIVTEPGKVYRLSLDRDLDPASLAPMPEPALLGRGNGRGLVRAAIDARRHLAVSIETRDDGHAGEYGFMYTDDGFDRADLEGVQLDSQHEQRIDDGWVTWHFDLD